MLMSLTGTNDPVLKMSEGKPAIKLDSLSHTWKSYLVTSSPHLMETNVLYSIHKIPP